MKKSVTAAERKKDFHAGPHNSFPIGPAGEHLRAAWDLAGHAADPEAVRQKILAFAHEHGLTDHLPEAAKQHMAKKATSSAVQQLFSLAWNHESMEGDRPQQARLARFASDHGLAHLLPDEAHPVMHEHNIPHSHPGVPNDEQGMHVHTLTKSYNPIAKEGLIIKSWEVGDDVFIEGWLSTPALDLEKDITEPESFMDSMDGYFMRRAPLSIEHNGRTLPIGHLQKGAIVRDGKILKEAQHPTDPADFEHFPGVGSGVWVRGVANEEPGKSALRKGNVGGMSFIANGREMQPIPGGRYRYTKLDPWIESTVAAYPVNPQAVIAVAKAYGLQPETPQEVNPPMSQNELTLEELLALAAEAQNKKEADVQKAQPLTAESLAPVLAEFKTSIEQMIEEKVTKALPVRGEGVGRKGTLQSDDPRDADPVSYAVKKAQSGEDLDTTDKALIWAMTEAVLGEGLK
jgi:hypothetical protein